MQVTRPVIANPCQTLDTHPTSSFDSPCKHTPQCAEFSQATGRFFAHPRTETTSSTARWPNATSTPPPARQRIQQRPPVTYGYQGTQANHHSVLTVLSR
ncbi:hypothetical protein TcWFU_007212 [Taenia crassiceps]|uniref:Uncharacterized protein n=1 Tax=Taenia crassiceps TaxID=6207 RepID=A0ABR4QM50_9CEST